MKSSPLLFIIICLSIICALFSGAVFALEQEEARVLPVWSTETFFAGSSANVQIFFTSNYSETLTIYQVGLHFDWMNSGDFVGLDVSANPVTVLSNESYIFPPINIIIPQDASIGTHSYFVGIDGIEGVSTNFSWDSLTRALQIQGSGEPANNDGTPVEGQQDSWLIIVEVAVAVGVAVLVVIFIFIRRKRRQTAPVNGPTET
jgi:hypothetical protein